MAKSRSIPKFVESLFSLFPVAHLLLITINVVLFIKYPTITVGCALVGIVYLFPLAIWRLIGLFYPLLEGEQYIGKKESNGNAWMISYHIQYLFLAFPLFERILIVIPGVFSLWLRLWGSRIGSHVFWTPRVEILDRSLLDIGDYVLFGDQSYMSGHLIKRKGTRLMLHVNKIVIGHRALIGFGSKLGPGTLIKQGEMLPALSKCFLGRITKGGDSNVEFSA